LLATIPFDLMLPSNVSDNSTHGAVLQSLSMLKLFRVLRLSRLIAFMNSNDDMKHTLRILSLVFFIILYIHFMGCLLFFIGSFDKKWTPNIYDGDKDFYEIDIYDQWKNCFLVSVLALLGNDIEPASSN